MSDDHGLTIEQIGSAVLFAESVEPLLAADPLRNTLSIGWLDLTLQAEQRMAAELNARRFGTGPVTSQAKTSAVDVGEQSLPWPPIMQVVRRGEDVVAALIQSRRSGVTCILDPNLEPEIVDKAMFLVGSELASVGPQITVLTGPAAAVEPINAGLVAAGGQSFSISLRMTLQELRHLPLPPAAPPTVPAMASGWSRPPDPQDDAEMALLARWQHEFSTDVGLTPEADRPSVRLARESLARSRVLFWCNQSGPVAMAAYGTDSDGEVMREAARIFGVYSPGELRGRGFGKAITDAVCQDARRRGAQRVLLFADVNAGAPNRIYRQLGFLPVTEFLVMNRVL